MGPQLATPPSPSQPPIVPPTVVRRRLPFRITLLLTLVLIITVLSAVRLYTGIAWKSPLDVYLGSLEVTYIAVTGAFWMAAGGFVLWSFWRGGRRIREIFLGASAAYAAWAWADRLIVQPMPRANWLFALAATILLLAFVAAVVLDPRNLPYLRKESYDRKPKKPTAA